MFEYLWCNEIFTHSLCSLLVRKLCLIWVLYVWTFLLTLFWCMFTWYDTKKWILSKYVYTYKVDLKRLVIDFKMISPCWLYFFVMDYGSLVIVKSRYSEKVTKFEKKIFHLDLTLLSSVKSKWKVYPNCCVLLSIFEL